MFKKIIFTSISLCAALSFSSAYATQTKIEASAIAKVEAINSVDTGTGTVLLPQIQTAAIVKKTDTSIFNGESTNSYNISAFKHEIKKLSDITPMMSLGKLYVSVVKDVAPQNNQEFIFHTSTVQKGLLAISLGKETAYLASRTVELKNGTEKETLTPDVATEGFSLLIDTERTKDNNLISKITLSEQKVVKMNDFGHGVSGPDYNKYSLSNRVFSHPGDTLVIHTAAYKSGDKNYQNVYYITIY